MWRRAGLATALLAGLPFPGCAPGELPVSCAGTARPSFEIGRAEHVLVLVIDGLHPGLLDGNDAPTLHGRLSSAAYTLSARTVIPSKTLPAHVSMVTGLTPERHDVRWNEWKPRRGPIGPRTIFDAAEDAGLRSALFAGKQKLRHLVRGGVPTLVGIAERDDRTVMQEAIEALRGHRPALTMIHLPDVDRAGHDSGWMSHEQRAAMRVADAEVARLLAVLEETGLADRSAVIVTADHGGEGRRHRHGRPADLVVPWLAFGRGIAPGKLEPVCVTATAEVASRLLRLPALDQRSTSTSSP